MLADGVEAAARALDNPNHKRLESLIEGIVADRMADGQLDESGLTFADLNRIKETFLTVLMGFYHIRVKYPGDEAEADSDSEMAGRKIAAENESSPTNGETTHPSDSEGDQVPKTVD